jgi:hypothetical protein
MKPGPHLARPSYYRFMIHQQDLLLNQGFDYSNKLFETAMSNYMLIEPRKEYTFLQFQKLLVFLIDSAGSIKKAFNYTVDKNYRVHT